MEFRTLQIQENLHRAVDDLGFENMTEIQEKAIPLLLDKKDIIGKSQTGTGKTLAFAIPAIEKIEVSLRKPQVLVLLPTRELALQVAEEFRKILKYHHGVKVAAIYGGASMENQIRELKSGAQIIVGTPGRVMDHMRRRTLKFDALGIVVLDEADEMLNMGFREDIEIILQDVPEDLQTALFSATMPQPIIEISKKYLKQPTKVEISPKNMVAPGIEQKYFNIADQNKFEALTRLIDVYKPNRALIFCNTKHFVDELTENLQELNYSVDKIHGDMRQISRLNVLKRFSEGRLKILVATDVAARGIDVDDVDIVFNYDVPDNEEYYVHRIGRTGRAGKSGLSLTLARSRDQFRLRKITDYTKKSIEKDLIPTSDVINAVKVAHFKERFNMKAESVEPLEHYLKIVHELEEKGYNAKLIAAILIKNQLPLSDADDLNTDFKRSGNSRDGRQSRNSRDGRGRDEGRRSRKDRGRSFGPEKTKKLFISIGDKDGVQKRDILGAICGESQIQSSSVGNIEMYKKFTFVDIEESLAKKVEKKLNGKTIKGNKVKVEISKDK